MAGINDLPIELFELIFGYLNLTIDDLFKYRLVNKKFKNSTFRLVNKLMVNEMNNEISNDFWFYNNELVNDDYTISSKCFREIRLRSIFDLNVYLKYLRINFKKDHYNEFKKELLNLDDLINLECLEIYSGGYQKFEDFKLDINLKNLKYFKFQISDLDTPCKLNTPKLEKIQFLKFENENKPQILIESNLKSIKHLIADNYEDGLKTFKNLEIIELENTSKLDENLLSFFIYLKQLKINRVARYRNRELDDCLVKILEKRKESNRDIDIYLEGVKIIDVNKLNEYQSYGYDTLYFQLDNYDLLDLKMPSNKCIQYDHLNNYYHNLRNDLPSSFFSKCQDTFQVVISKIKGAKRINANDLNWFLNNLKCLKSLQITSILFDQQFFNNLPNTIRDLEINDERRRLYRDSNINFDFILKFNKLNEFSQDGWNIDPLDLILTAFLNLKNLRYTGFWYKNKKIIITKKDGCFKLKISGSSDSELDNRLDYDQLVEKFNELKSEREPLFY